VKVLLDHCVDIRFDRLISGHEVVHTRQLGWQQLSNGKLLLAAEEGGFTVFVTVDKNVRFQQNMAKKNISLVTLSSRLTGFDQIAPLADQLVEILERDISPGSDIVVSPTGD